MLSGRKTSLRNKSRLPAALKRKREIVPPVMQAATNGGVRDDNVSVHLFILPRKAAAVKALFYSAINRQQVKAG
jgi:hypothetical protein